MFEFHFKKVKNSSSSQSGSCSDDLEIPESDLYFGCNHELVSKYYLNISSIFHKLNSHQTSTSIQRNDSFHQSRNLIDDSVLEDAVQEPTSLQLHLQNDTISSGSSEGETVEYPP